MYEFHGWVALSDSTYESDFEVVAAGVAELGTLLEGFPSPLVAARIEPRNGQYFLSLEGLTNHKGRVAALLDEVLAYVCERLPGSYGLVYVRDDEGELEADRNVFRVRVIARGGIDERADPFLSPCRPTIED